MNRKKRIAIACAAALATFGIISSADAALVEVRAVVDTGNPTKQPIQVSTPPYSASDAETLSDPSFCGQCSTSVEAHSSIATGSLGISSKVTRLPVGQQLYRPGIAYAGLSEEIRFTSASLTAGTIATVPFTIYFEGGFSEDIDGSVSFGATVANVNEIAGATNPNWNVLVGVTSNAADLGNNRIVSAQGTFTKASLISGNRFAVAVFSGLIDVAVNKPSNALLVQFSIEGYGAFDFANTAGFSFGELPADIAFTSSSAVFLTSVPLPSSAWLLGSAVLGILRSCARRTTKTPCTR